MCVWWLSVLSGQQEASAGTPGTQLGKVAGILWPQQKQQFLYENEKTFKEGARELASWLRVLAAL